MPSTSSLSASSTLALLLIASACTSDTPEAGGVPVTVRDSAGIRIVESAPDWPMPEIWTVSAEPTVQIGTIEGEEDYLLDGVRSVVTDAAGRIVALEGMSRLRWYDGEGVHLRTLDFFGEGPMEIQGAHAVHRYLGDSLVVTGGMRGGGGQVPGQQPYPGGVVPERTLFSEFIVLDPAGDLSRRGMVWAEGGRQEEGQRGFANTDAAAAILADGSFVNFGNPVMQIAGNVGERVPSRYAVTRSTPEGSQIPDTLAIARYSEVDLPAGGSDATSNVRLPYQTVLFAPWVVNPATFGNRLYLADSKDASVRVIEVEGIESRLAAVWRPAIPAEPVTDETFEEYLRLYAIQYDLSPEDARDLRDRFSQLGRAETFPLIEEVRIDGSGNLWMSKGRFFSSSMDRVRSSGNWPEIEGGPTRWTVFSPDGTPLGSVLTPAGFAVHEIGDDYILGVTTDELAVQYIQRFTLEKPAG